MRVEPPVNRSKTVYPWKRYGAYTSKGVAGLNKIRFVQKDGHTICQLEGRKLGVPYNIELSQLLRNEVAEGTFVDVWEDIFYTLYRERPGPEILTVIASAGAAVGLREQDWPHFSHNLEVIGEFRKRLPLAAQKPFLLYCKKEWGQSLRDNEGTDDFLKWCDLELEFVTETL